MPIARFASTIPGSNGQVVGVYSVISPDEIHVISRPCDINWTDGLMWHWTVKSWGCCFRRLLQPTTILRGPQQWCAVPCRCHSLPRRVICWGEQVWKQSHESWLKNRGANSRASKLIRYLWIFMMILGSRAFLMIFLWTSCKRLARQVYINGFRPLTYNILYCNV